MSSRNDAVLITDLDNTLYDFVAYYEAGLSALIAELCMALKLGEDTVTDRLRQIYTHHGSIEYPFAVEEIPEVLTLGDADRVELVRRCMTRFWRAGCEQLEAYPTVHETLRQLYAEGSTVIAHTDAPIHEVTRRLRYLGLARYLRGIVAQNWFGHRPVRSRVAYLPEVPGWSRPPRQLEFLWRIPTEDRKPNPGIYQRLAACLDIPARAGTVIGDSISRDLTPAVGAGFGTVWARYGHRAKASDLMLSVVPQVLPEVGAPPATVSGITCVDSFAGVLEYLPCQQVLDSLWKRP